MRDTGCCQGLAECDIKAVKDIDGLGGFNKGLVWIIFGLHNDTKALAAQILGP